MSWQSKATALGWTEERITALVDRVRAEGVFVLLVTENVLAFRTERGALQCLYRSNEPSCFARGRRDTAHLPEYTPRPDPFCPAWKCKHAVPCPVHGAQAAGGQR